MPDPHVEPHLFVIFGATGDLMRRKLLPALYKLADKGRFGEPFKILGIARDANLDDASFRQWARKVLREAGLNNPNEIGRWCDRCLHYQPIGAGDEKVFHALRERIEALEQAHHLPGNRTFYLALPPRAFAPTIEGLGEAGLNRSPGKTRLVIEKPFGRNLATAQALNRLLHRYFDESQIYRIDHYLGKETVQNLMIFRFANPIFESLWNRDRVDSVEITVAETVGVEKRAGYYDHAGALRDMAQNHLTQLLTLISMEAPVAFDADAIRDEKVKVLRATLPLDRSEVVFGQYEGYRNEPGVAPDSNTETFVALGLHIENWRWQGVPFFLRTGKKLARRLTQIVVRFRRPPVALFEPYPDCRVHANALILRLQPDEGFELCFEVKSPVEGITMETQRLHFRYDEAFGPLPDAYETLLLDVVTNDQTLFVRADEVEASWRLYDPLLEERPPVHPYEPGSWGPPEADHLLERTGRRWMVV